MPVAVGPNPYRLSDDQWARIEPILPVKSPSRKGGRPREDDRAMMDAIYFVLRTGMQWNALPREYGASSTAHDRFQEWRDAGVFELLWLESLLEYDQRVGIDWEWQSMDGAMTKAPLGGEKNGTQSHRPGQERREAQPARGRQWNPRGRGDRRREQERPSSRGRNA
jgi:putative transposase